jgi:hypothetical protein
MMRVTKMLLQKKALKRTYLVLACLISLGSVSAQTTFPSVAGNYEGTFGPLAYQVRLHVRPSSSTTLTGTLDSIDQDAIGIPCAEFILSGSQFSFFTSPSDSGSYKGEISADGNTITGSWIQPGYSIPLVFTRIVWSANSVPAKSASPANSQWVHPGPGGKLVYATTPKGDRIPDFSSAGYLGGGVSLPDVATSVKVSPTGSADDTPAIEAAIDQVAKLAPDAQGIRGAVQLAPGTFHLKGTLHLNVSGVVLRGAGSEGPHATVLEMTGDPHLAMEIKGDFQKRGLGSNTTLTDSYVPAGATLIHVANAGDIHPGDTLQIVKPVTPEWVHSMGMDHMVRDGKPENWVQNDIRVFRKVASVKGNEIELEVPLTDSFDSHFYSADRPTVTRVALTGQVAETGVEYLRIVAPNRSIDYHQDARFDGIDMDNLTDSWLRGLAFVDITNSVSIGHNAERLTVVQVDVRQDATVTSHAQPFDFSVAGSQILLDRCSGSGDRVTYVATQSHSQGPVVVLHCRFTGGGRIEGHQRWSTGLLVDSSEVAGGDINLRNRGIMGSGHGWANGWSVLWNDKANTFLVQNPPGDMNWAIGDEGIQAAAAMPGSTDGIPLPRGAIESVGKHVEPSSLYLAQLWERKGAAAVTAIGYPVETNR